MEIVVTNITDGYLVVYDETPVITFFINTAGTHTFYFSPVDSTLDSVVIKSKFNTENIIISSVSLKEVL